MNRFVLSLVILVLCVSFVNAQPNLLLNCSFDNTLECSDGETPSFAEGTSFAQGVKNEGVLIDSNDALDYLTTNNILASQGTVMLWVIPYKNASDNAAAYIFDVFDRYGGTNSFSRLDIRHSSLTGEMLVFSLNPHTDGGPNEAALFTSSLWDAGKPHHLAFVWDEQQYIKAYIDGTKVGENTSGFPKIMQGLSTVINLGYYKDTRAHQFNGILDELKIYDAPLTDQEIQQDYSGNSTEPQKDCEQIRHDEKKQCVEDSQLIFKNCFNPIKECHNTYIHDLQSCRFPIMPCVNSAKAKFRSCVMNNSIVNINISQNENPIQTMARFFNICNDKKKDYKRSCFEQAETNYSNCLLS